MFLPRNTTADHNSATSTDNTHAHTSLAHRNLVGVLVIAALLALALALSLCFAKWSKPIRRFLRRERSTRVRSGLARDGLPSLSKPPPPPPPPPPTHAADAEKASATIPDSSSTQCSLEIDESKERANVQVALPAKVLSVLERL
jgi:hypothetical protein